MPSYRVEVTWLKPEIEYRTVDAPDAEAAIEQAAEDVRVTRTVQDYGGCVKYGLVTEAHDDEGNPLPDEIGADTDFGLS